MSCKGLADGVLPKETPLQSVKPRYRPLFFLFLPIQIGNAVLPGVLLFLLVRGLFNTIGYSGGTGIIIRSPSMRGIAEEAPAAYKDVSSVVAVAEKAGLSKRVARLEPVVCLKG